MFDKVYRQRREQRNKVYERVKHDNKKLKCAPKHNDRKYTVQMIGEQAIEASQQYTTNGISKRILSSVLVGNTILQIKKEGTKVQQNMHVEKSTKHAECVRKKRLSSDKWEEITLDQHLERVRNSQMDYDKVWANRGHAETMKKVNALLIKTHWSKVKVDGGFFEELQFL